MIRKTKTKLLTTNLYRRITILVFNQQVNILFMQIQTRVGKNRFKIRIDSKNRTKMTYTKKFSKNFKTLKKMFKVGKKETTRICKG